MNPLKCISNYCGLYHAKKDQCPCCMNKLTAETGNSSRASVLFGKYTCKVAALQNLFPWCLGHQVTGLSMQREENTKHVFAWMNLSWRLVKTELLKILQVHPSIQNIILKLIYCKFSKKMF